MVISNNETVAVADRSRRDARALARFLGRHESLAVLSGAGCSTASGIPDYRDEEGNWKHRQPVRYADFLGSEASRQRYWARSFAGWERVASARPNAAHLALAELERAGRVSALITQNVDSLHRAAGHCRVIDLHGVLSRVRCLDCGAAGCRRAFQAALAASNPGWHDSVERYAPDGDAEIGPGAREFVVPPCPGCGGVLKPDVVFFGENVPAQRVAEAGRRVSEADALLVVGSSLMVFSGFRFARMAAALGKPLAIVNLGRTRADELATLRIRADCGELLAASIAELAG